jgi:hypothetical protein
MIGVMQCVTYSAKSGFDATVQERLLFMFQANHRNHPRASVWVSLHCSFIAGSRRS